MATWFRLPPTITHDEPERLPSTITHGNSELPTIQQSRHGDINRAADLLQRRDNDCYTPCASGDERVQRQRVAAL